jgi:DNA-binding SARP family transcriptional activator/streptogramin lyase
MALGFLILGPFEVHLNDEALALGGRQQRALLAALTLRANELVSSERLIDELWPEDPPDTADHLVHVYVSRLRKVLGDEGRSILVTRPPGYQLLIERGQLDLHRFEDLIASAATAADDERATDAIGQLREALALWRGPALADLASESFARADAERLNELRMSATEDLMGSELAAGGDDLVAELKSLVAQHPLRERLRSFLMVALYRQGRQAEALDVYERTRAVLAEELGIDPSQELQDMHHRVLSQDSTLLPTPPKRSSEDGAEAVDEPLQATQRHSGEGRRLRAAVAIVASISLLAIGLVVVTRPSTAPIRSAGRSVIALIDGTTNAYMTQIAFGGLASAIAADGEDLWVADDGAGTVTRIHTTTQASDGPVSSVVDPVAITAGDGRAWVIDPFAGRITALGASGQIDTGFTWRSSAPVDGVYVQGALWVVDSACECVFRLDAATGKVEEKITLPFTGAGPMRIDAGPGAIWILNGIARSLVRISPWNGRAVGDPISLAYQPTDLAVSKDAVWVSMEGNDLVEKLSPAGASLSDVPVAGGPSTIVADSTGAWVLTSRGGRIVRLTGTTATPVSLAMRPNALAQGGAGAWVSLAPVHVAEGAATDSQT